MSPGTFTVDNEIGLTEPTFVLRNRPKLTVTVKFPPEPCCDEHGNAITDAPRSSRASRSQKLKVERRPRATASIFEYTVELTSAGIEAEGNSRPGVEIVP